MHVPAPHALEKRAWQSKLIVGLSLFSTALAIFVAGTTILIVLRQFTALPVWDQWNEITIADHATRLLAQHNEHRILFPRLIFIVDKLLVGGKNVLSVGSTFIAQAATVGLLFAAILRAASDSPGVAAANARTAQTVWLFGICICLLFSAQQVENFRWGFQVQFVGVFTAAIAGFLTLSFHPGSTVALCCAIALAFVSAFTMANGTAAPIILIAIGVLLRIRALHLLALIVAAVVIVGLYFHDYHSIPGHGKPMESIFFPGRWLPYVLGYIGAPLSGAELSVRRAIAAGSAVLIALGFALVLVAARRDVRPIVVSLCAIAVFLLLTAFLTSLGRASLTTDQVLESRYCTPALLLIFTTIALWYVIGEGALAPLRTLSLTAGLAISVILAIGQLTHLRVAEKRHMALLDAETAVLGGVWDESVMTGLVQPWDWMEKRNALLAHRYSVFGDPVHRWMGTRVASHVDLTTACRGAFDDVSLVPGPGQPVGRVSGWLAKDAEQSRTIVIADQNGIVVGYALAARNTTGKIGWRGHVNIRSQATLAALVVSADGKSACELADARRVPAVEGLQIVESGSAGRPLGINAPVIEGSFGLDGYDPVVGPPPVNGPAFGSWGGSDANTGRIMLPIEEQPDDGMLLLPLMRGPSADGLVLKLRDQQGELLNISVSAIPPFKWTILRIPTGNVVGSGRLQIYAEDAGRQWGQWMAIGAPRHQRQPDQ